MSVFEARRHHLPPRALGYVARLRPGVCKRCRVSHDRPVNTVVTAARTRQRMARQSEPLCNSSDRDRLEA